MVSSPWRQTQLSRGTGTYYTLYTVILTDHSRLRTSQVHQQLMRTCDLFYNLHQHMQTCSECVCGSSRTRLTKSRQQAAFSSEITGKMCWYGERESTQEAFGWKQLRLENLLNWKLGLASDGEPEGSCDCSPLQQTDRWTQLWGLSGETVHSPTAIFTHRLPGGMEGLAKIK